MLDFLFLPISNLMCLLSSLLLFIHVCLPKHWVFWVGSPLRMAAMAAIQAMPPGHALLHRQLAGPVLAQLGWVQPGTLLENKSWGKGKELHHKVRSASLDNQIDFRLGWECALRSAWNRHPVKKKWSTVRRNFLRSHDLPTIDDHLPKSTIQVQGYP